MVEPVKISTSIPKEWHDMIVEFNKDANRPINMASVMRNAIKKEIDKIEEGV
jgi:hypothetical protein